jgi:hypothetical protein
MYYSGLRPEEAINLGAGNVDVPAPITKVGDDGQEARVRREGCFGSRTQRPAAGR